MHLSRVCTSGHLYFITRRSKGNGIQLIAVVNLFLLRGTRINHRWSRVTSILGWNATCRGRIEISLSSLVPAISFEPSKSSDTSRWSLSPPPPLTACSTLDQLAATFLLWKTARSFLSLVVVRRYIRKRNYTWLASQSSWLIEILDRETFDFEIFVRLEERFDREER